MVFNGIGIVPLGVDMNSVGLISISSEGRSISFASVGVQGDRIRCLATLFNPASDHFLQRTHGTPFQVVTDAKQIGLTKRAWHSSSWSSQIKHGWNKRLDISHPSGELVKDIQSLAWGWHVWSTWHWPAVCGCSHWWSSELLGGSGSLWQSFASCGAICTWSWLARTLDMEEALLVCDHYVASILVPLVFVFFRIQNYSLGPLYGIHFGTTPFCCV